MSHLRWLLLLAAPGAAGAAPVDFARDVLPVLSDHCFACHGPDAAARKAKLRLDDRKAAIDHGAITPGKSMMSELFARVTSTDPDLVMPPPGKNKKITPAQADILKRWIDEGANWGTHWAFTPPKSPPVPATTHPTRNPVDAFVRARLDKEGVAPSADATKEQLIRRVSLDLTGLPPTLDEIDAFLRDESFGAYERVVDRLLASPRYGERMAWDWLDAARYADSNGYQGDQERTMWPWRDWVVRAFNENMPFDRFTVEQIAGDRMPNATKEQILATGFNRNHMINGEGGRIAEENRIEYVFDQAETTATVWMGLTFTCCRCHDHKFDPIAKSEYFGLFAFFNQSPVNGGGGSGQTEPVVEYATPDLERRRAEAQREFAAAADAVAAMEPSLGVDATKVNAIKKKPADRNDAEFDEVLKAVGIAKPDYAALVAKLREAKRRRDDAAKAIPRVMVMGDMPKPRETFMLTRGAYDKPEGKVTPAVPAVLPPLPANTSLDRLALARWLVAPDHPLTARVTVNRAWQLFFGTGLVRTADDFGVQGERPTHPELLDWLAVRFMQSGWDVKELHRLIVTSATYRQSSKVTPAALERDPANRLLARGPRRRMPSWMLRDQALAASGLLTNTVGGPAVKPYQPAGVWEEATFGQKSYRQDAGEALYRRSLYVFWRRIVGPTMFFDTANRQACAVKTDVTNTPLHALVLLNEPTFVEAGRALAQQVLQRPGTDAERLADAFRRVLGRHATEREQAVLLAALAKQRKAFADAPDAEVQKLLKVGESARDEAIAPREHAAFAVVCSLMLNLDETQTRQ